MSNQGPSNRALAFIYGGMVAAFGILMVIAKMIEDRDRQQAAELIRREQEWERARPRHKVYFVRHAEDDHITRENLTHEGERQALRASEELSDRLPDQKIKLLYGSTARVAKTANLIADQLPNCKAFARQWLGMEDDGTVSIPRMIRHEVKSLKDNEVLVVVTHMSHINRCQLQFDQSGPHAIGNAEVVPIEIVL